MKVAIITNYWKNSDGGGVKTYLVNLVEELQVKGVEVCVLYREGYDPEHFRGGMNKIMFSWSCYKQLRRIRPDVIHAHGSWFCLFPGFVYKKFNGGKLLFTFHTEPVDKLSLPGKVFFRSILNACDHVTFVSNNLRKRVKEVDGFEFSKSAITYADVKARVVTDEEGHEFCERFGIKENSIILLAQGMTAHILKADGLKILFTSINLLKSHNTKIVLLVTREGYYSNELKNFVEKLDIRDQVIFTGNLDNPYVPLKICDVYTHITLGDGLPIALLEAMVMGKPIIATSVGGIPEAIVNGNNGILVEPDADEIAKQTELLLDNITLQSILGKNAKLTVSDKFTWEKAAHDILKLYSI